MVALDLYITVLIFVKKKLDRITEGWKNLFGLVVSEGTLHHDGEGKARQGVAHIIRARK